MLFASFALPHTVTSFLLGTVQGRIRTFDQFCAIPLISCFRDTQTDGRFEISVIFEAKALDIASNRLSDFSRSGGVLPGQNQSEFFTSVPVLHAIATVTSICQNLRHSAKNIVTHLMSEYIVHSLKVVNVHHDKSYRLFPPQRVIKVAVEAATVKDANGNAAVLAIGVLAARQTEGGPIHIHVTGTEKFHTTVTNAPDSECYHRTLFRNLRQLLIDQNCWSYGEEGVETESRVETVNV